MVISKSASAGRWQPTHPGRFAEMLAGFFFRVEKLPDLPLASRGGAFFTGVFGKVGGVGFLNEFLNKNPILARKK